MSVTWLLKGLLSDVKWATRSTPSGPTSTLRVLRSNPLAVAAVNADCLHDLVSSRAGIAVLLNEVVKLVF